MPSGPASRESFNHLESGIDRLERKIDSLAEQIILVREAQAAQEVRNEEFDELKADRDADRVRITDIEKKLTWLLSLIFGGGTSAGGIAGWLTSKLPGASS